MRTFLRFAQFNHPVLFLVLVMPLFLSQHPHPPSINTHIRLPSTSHCPSLSLPPEDYHFLPFLVHCVTLQRARRVPSQSTVLSRRTFSQRTTHPYSPQPSTCPTGVAYHLLLSTLSRPLSLSPALVGRWCCLLELCWRFASLTPS